MAPELLNGSSSRVSEKVKIMPNDFCMGSFKQQRVIEFCQIHIFFSWHLVYHEAEYRVPFYVYIECADYSKY